MNTIQYNFKSIPPIPPSSTLIDIVLSRTQSKTPTVVHPGYKITRIRKFYMRKVRFTSTTISEKLTNIITTFPKLDNIHPFYADLINILYDKDHYKLALSQLNTAKNICDKLSTDYVKLLKYADSLYRCKQLKVAALGRMATCLKKLNSSLLYLEQVRQHLSRLPSIDPTGRTLILSGFPNVGKSSFMNKITYADSEVQAYHFTTQSLYVGHTFFKNIKWQVIDTPGILDRSLEERNIIEMQTITALAHLDACILFFIDISESCGYSIEQQINLFSSVKPLFKNKPLVIIANKIDLKKYEDLSSHDREVIEKAAKEYNTYLIKMSNENGTGVFDVKKAACEILLKYREITNHGAAGKDITGMDKVYVAYPKNIRDNRKREPNIPKSFIEDKNNKIEIDEDNEETKKKDMEKFLREDNIDALEKKLVNNPVRDYIEAHGGQGIYYKEQREEFDLPHPEQVNDIWPEIYNGKNVMDFIDPDILKKVEALEKEEENNNNEIDIQEDDMNDSESDLSEDLIEAHEKVMENQKKIRDRHQLVKKSRVPRRLTGSTATEKFMEEVRKDFKEKTKNVKMIGEKMRREQKEKVKRNLKKENEEEEDEKINEEDNMDIDEDNIRLVKKKKLSPEEEQKIKIQEQKNKVIERMKRKIQKGWSRQARVNEADRKIGDKKPKFFNSGKRGIGKTDWR
jgi:nucleolar GTP-binding protein